jgi:hypothetical protein
MFSKNKFQFIRFDIKTVGEFCANAISFYRKTNALFNFPNFLQTFALEIHDVKIQSNESGFLVGKY